MRMFCDESGGTDRTRRHFIVPMVLIEQHVARQVIKSLRKETRLRSEIKGYLLKPSERRIFFELLEETSEYVIVAIVCDRGAPVGGWAMSTLEEWELRAEMVIQSCTILGLTEPFQRLAAHNNRINIIQDGGRYTKRVLGKAEKFIAQELQRRFCGISFTHRYGDSRNFAGIQIADIVGNTLYRSRSRNDDAKFAKRLIKRQVISRRLIVEAADIKHRWPKWLHELIPISAEGDS